METSLADIAAVTRDNDGFGNNGLWLFAILALMGGGFGNWNRGNYGAGDYGQFATAASQQEILFGQQFQGLNNAINSHAQAIDNKIDRIGNGIADATFSLNNTIVNGDNAIMARVADGFSATQQAIHAEGEATRNMLQQNKIEALQGQINQLQLQSALCGVVRYPNATTYNAGTSPFCNCGNGCCGNI